MAPAAVHVLRHRVEWGETDAAGIVFYPNYFRWMDRATHEFFRASGRAVVSMLTGGYAVPLVSASANFKRALRYDEQIEIVTRVSEIRTRSFTLSHEMRRAGETVADGSEVRLWARVEAGVVEAARIPDDVRAVLGAEVM